MYTELSLGFRVFHIYFNRFIHHDVHKFVETLDETILSAPNNMDIKEGVMGIRARSKMEEVRISYNDFSFYTHLYVVIEPYHNSGLLREISILEL